MEWIIPAFFGAAGILALICLVGMARSWHKHTPQEAKAGRKNIRLTYVGIALITVSILCGIVAAIALGIDINMERVPFRGRRAGQLVAIVCTSGGVIAGGAVFGEGYSLVRLFGGRVVWQEPILEVPSAKKPR